MAILSSLEEILTHQLGGNPLGKLRTCCCFFAVLFLTVEHPLAPTPRGALFPSLSHTVFKASSFSLLLSYIFTYFVIRSLPVGSKAFLGGDFLVTFALFVDVYEVPAGWQRGEVGTCSCSLFCLLMCSCMYTVTRRCCLNGGIVLCAGSSFLGAG